MDTYGEVRRFEFPGMVARVHIPILTDEERGHRMQAIHNAAAKLLLQVKNVDKIASGVQNDAVNDFSPEDDRIIDRG